VQLHDTTVPLPNDRTLALTTTAPGPGQFRVLDDNTLDLQVPIGTAPRWYLLFVRPAVGKPTLALWLVVT
jgi:hypothetical protein